MLDPKATELLSRGWYKERLSADDCRYLLTFPAKSPIANLAISLADRLNRQACSNTGQICAIIETSTGPCSHNCAFCRFAEGTTDSEFFDIDDGVLARYAEEIGSFSDVRSIKLETYGDADVGELARHAGIVRDHSKRGTRIIVDTGDLDLDGCKMLKKAGVFGACHACRIGEGKDTEIKPERRLETIKNLVDSGLGVITSSGPFGLDTVPGNIVDNFYQTLNMGCCSCEVVPREPVPGTKYANMNPVIPARLSQIRAVLTLASSWYVPRIRIASPGTYVVGKNVAFARYYAKEGRQQLEAARRRLFNAEYHRLLKTDDTTTELSLAYLRQTGSV